MVDPALVQAWLTARSIARNLPLPVADHGGWRVDTNSDTEICRWVFASLTDRLVDLATSVRTPRRFIKLCDTAETLQAAVPEWQVKATGYFMTAGAAPSPTGLPRGYELDVQGSDQVSTVRIMASDGSLAASGYAAQTSQAFVYDRIETAEAHRRRGLGRAVMAALGGQRSADVPQLLVATEDGRELYETLGWRVLSPYATAVRPD